MACLGDQELQENRVGMLANIAEAFFLVGDVEAAVAAMQQAIAEADNGSVDQQFQLACQSAEVGAYWDALVFLARTLSLRHGLPVPPEDVPGHLTDAERDLLLAFTGMSKMLAAIESGGANLVRSWSQTPRFAHERDGEGVRGVYEETRATRERATQAVLGPST
jgi:hypothetical protein